MSYKNLKSNSGSVEKLTKELEKINAPTFTKDVDERFWKPELDKAGNGYAVIRFLPAPEVDGEDALPWVRIFDHGFQGLGGKWYIENSLTTLNQKDPVSEYNSALWAQSSDDKSPQRTQVRLQKRRLHYIANIQIVEDSKNPDNVGKIKLFKFGKKIFDKITEAMNPQFEDEKPINPFDFWAGANFKLKVRKVEGYQNYDKSEFEKPSALFNGDDKKLEALYKSEYSLKAFLDAKHFKSYDVLKTKLEQVLGITSVAAPVAATAPVATKRPTVEDVQPDATEDDDDGDLARFAKLAEED